MNDQINKLKKKMKYIRAGAAATGAGAGAGATGAGAGAAATGAGAATGAAATGAGAGAAFLGGAPSSAIKLSNSSKSIVCALGASISWTLVAWINNNFYLK